MTGTPFGRAFREAVKDMIHPSMLKVTRRPPLREMTLPVTRHAVQAAGTPNDVSADLQLRQPSLWERVKWGIQDLGDYRGSMSLEEWIEHLRRNPQEIAKGLGLIASGAVGAKYLSPWVGRQWRSLFGPRERREDVVDRAPYIPPVDMPTVPHATFPGGVSPFPTGDRVISPRSTTPPPIYTPYIPTVPNGFGGYLLQRASLQDPYFLSQGGG
jgi:hypothetical protein